MPRKQKWEDPGFIGFRTEQYIIDELREDIKKDGFSDFTDYFNFLILKILGGDNDAVKQYLSRHQEYEPKIL